MTNKFVLILADQINPRNLAHVGSLIGFQFGRKVPEMVGRNQEIPKKRDDAIEGYETRTHLGITTQNLPVLNGLSFDNMRALRNSLRDIDGLIMTEITDAVATSATYSEYAQAIATTPTEQVNYWGIGVYGDEDAINRCTQAQGLKLYDKQPKIPNADTEEKRLFGGELDGPVIKLVLANNLSGGRLANTATILGVTYGKLYGDSIFGPDLVDADGRVILGLPNIDLAILNGHSEKRLEMRAFREALHEQTDLSVVDVTDATGKTRDYGDYLAIAEATPVLETVYWGVGICGPNELVTSIASGFGPYITSAEEQAEIKKQETAKKVAARNAANNAGKAATEKKDNRSAFNSAAAEGKLGWQPQSSAAHVTKVDEKASAETVFSSTMG